MNKYEAIVQKQLEYYNQHDLEGFCSTYHEELVIYNLQDNTILFKGQEALRERYKMRFEVNKVHAEIQNRMIIGNKVIDHEHVTGLKKDEIVKAVAIYEIVDDLIMHVWFIYE